MRSLHTDGSDWWGDTDSGGRIRSRFVVLAIGFGGFANVPGELGTLFPPDHYDHTSRLVDF